MFSFIRAIPTHTLLKRAGLLCLVAATLLCAAATPATAQVLKDSLDETEGVGVEDRRGAQLPLQVVLHDSEGRPHRLGDYFNDDRPVILVMAYYTCPMLCTLVLNNVQSALNELDWVPGEEYRILTVSFDPRDTTDDARLRQETYLAGLRKQPTEDAWIFTTTTSANSREIADAIGFKYRFLSDVGEYSHPSAIFICAPDGTLHNFIENVRYNARDVKLAVVEASEGRSGSLFDRVALTCFRYDPQEGKYLIHPMGVMRLVGIITALGLGSTIGALLWTSSRRRRLEGESVDAVSNSDPARNDS